MKNIYKNKSSICLFLFFVFNMSITLSMQFCADICKKYGKNNRITYSFGAANIALAAGLSYYAYQQRFDGVSLSRSASSLLRTFLFSIAGLMSLMPSPKQLHEKPIKPALITPFKLVPNTAILQKLKPIKPVLNIALSQELKPNNLSEQLKSHAICKLANECIQKGQSDYFTQFKLYTIANEAAKAKKAAKMPLLFNEIIAPIVFTIDAVQKIPDETDILHTVFLVPTNLFGEFKKKINKNRTILGESEARMCSAAIRLRKRVTKNGFRVGYSLRDSIISYFCSYWEVCDDELAAEITLMSQLANKTYSVNNLKVTIDMEKEAKNLLRFLDDVKCFKKAETIDDYIDLIWSKYSHFEKVQDDTKEFIRKSCLRVAQKELLKNLEARSKQPRSIEDIKQLQANIDLLKLFYTYEEYNNVYFEAEDKFYSDLNKIDYSKDKFYCDLSKIQDELYTTAPILDKLYCTFGELKENFNLVSADSFIKAFLECEYDTKNFIMRSVDILIYYKKNEALKFDNVQEFR
jgi:hypothetical protein